MNRTASHVNPREALEKQCRDLEVALLKHRRNYAQLTINLIERLRAMREMRFLEMASGGACRPCSLFEVSAYNMHEFAAHAQTALVPTTHGLCIASSKTDSDADRYTLTLRPNSASASLVLPSVDASAASASHSESPLVFHLDVSVHETLPSNATKTTGGTPDPSAQQSSGLMSVCPKTLSVLSGYVPVSDQDLIMAGRYVARDLAECSTNGVYIEFVVHSTAADDQGRLRPIAVLDSIVFSAESILTSDDTPRWPMHIAQCIKPRNPKLYNLLRDNYACIVKLLYEKQQLQIALMEKGWDKCRHSTSAPPRLMYRLDTAQPLRVHPSRSGSSSGMRNRFGAEPGEEDSSCTVC